MIKSSVSEPRREDENSLKNEKIPASRLSLNSDSNNFLSCASSSFANVHSGLNFIRSASVSNFQLGKEICKDALGHFSMVDSCLKLLPSQEYSSLLE